MSEQQQSTNRSPVSPWRWQRGRVAPAFGDQPAGFWLAALASVSLIIGGVAPWATAFGIVSISGTSMHGWREVGVGAFGLAMLGLHLLRGARLPLVMAGVAGALGATLAIAALNKISSGGAVTVLGVQYRYMDAAWGLYLVLAGTITLLVCALALAWRAASGQQETGR
jgi:hypothetical protein